MWIIKCKQKKKDLTSKSLIVICLMFTSFRFSFIEKSMLKISKQFQNFKRSKVEKKNVWKKFVISYNNDIQNHMRYGAPLRIRYVLRMRTFTLIYIQNLKKKVFKVQE